MLTQASFAKVLGKHGMPNCGDVFCGLVPPQWALIDHFYPHRFAVQCEE